MKYDGYRLRLERDGNRVRLITRGGYNWTDRYPWIVEAALRWSVLSRGSSAWALRPQTCWSYSQQVAAQAGVRRSGQAELRILSTATARPLGIFFQRWAKVAMPVPQGGPCASRTVWTSCTRSGMWSATRVLGRPKGHDCLAPWFLGIVMWLTL